ncbi:MAG: CoA transferase subunit A [Chloroflexota bacterium]|nr:CoA transferase subunit A [Chloroflexota bacterium]
MSKLRSLEEAVARFIPDGCSVLLGAPLEALLPFAAAHEIIRQGRRSLTAIAPISDALLDQLIGAGCVRTVIAAWVGNVSAGLGANYRRAVEQGRPHPIEVQDHSNFSLALALTAAAIDAPFIPTRSLLGSDIASSNPRLERHEYRGQPLLYVPALRPDVAVLHVQRADSEGNAHCWGSLGMSREAFLASRQIVITAEEIVPADVISSDPNRVLGSHSKVAAVVHCPGGAHPSPVQGYYDRDHAFFQAYYEASRRPADFEAWLSDHVRTAYDRLAAVAPLRPVRRLPAAQVDYGY